MLASVPRITRYLALAVFLVLFLFFTWSSLPSPPDLTHVPGSGSSGDTEKTPPSKAPPKTTTPPPPPSSKDGVDWSRFAYFQYATGEEHVCQSVMIFESLHRLGAKADRIFLYPDTWRAEIEGGGSLEGAQKLLVTARDKYKVKLVPVKIQKHSGGDPTWAAGFTKLLSFNQTAYSRVLSVDSDANVMQPMDELFLLPPAVLAMPRAYWLSNESKTVLSNQMFLVTPSSLEWSRIEAAIAKKGHNDYDMDIMNKLYGQSCIVIPHRPYNCLSGEFKKGSNSTLHAQYMGSEDEKWKPKEIFKEVKFLHFSDWPLKKPWYRNREKDFEDTGPDCKGGDDPDCVDKEIWRGLYTDYATRRKEICDLDLL